MGRRCTECRKSIDIAASAATTQRVCGPACRARRDRKLARRRRRRDLDEARADERGRQQRRRERRAAAESHAPPSAANPAGARRKLMATVARALAASRATLAVQLADIIEEMVPQAGEQRLMSRGSLEPQAAGIT
jgi:hypothetical protein